MVVHMIGNAHIDPVWLWPWQAGLDEALASFRSAIARCEEYPEFIYTRGEAWLYQQVQEIDPDLFEQVRSLTAEGRWHITGGQWIQPDTNLPTGEAWRQQILHGQRFFREHFGRTPRTGYNVDSFGHPATLPDILSEFGYRGYVFHRPSQDQVKLPAQTFRWRGVGGNELIGFRIAPCYVTRTDDLFGQIMLSAEAADPNLGHTMCFYGVGNHGGGPTKANIGYIIEHAQAFDGIELRFSHPEAFFDAVESKRSELPIADCELQHTFPGCYSVMHDIKQRQRQGELLLETADRVTRVFSSGFTASEAETRRLDLAWKDLLFTQFHDILSGTSIDSAWDSVRAMQGRSFIAAEEIIARVTRKWSRKELPPVNQQQIALLNALPCAWEGWAECEPFLDFDIWRDRWLSTLDGTPVPFQEVQPHSQLSHFHRILFPAHIPAEGSLQLLLRDDEQPHAEDRTNTLRITETSLSNGLVEIRLAEIGISSIRYQGRELLGTDGLTLHLREDKSDTWTFHFDHYSGPIIGTPKPAKWSIQESGPLRARVCLETRIGQSSIRWILSLYKDAPRLAMTIEANFQEQHTILQMPMSLASAPTTWVDGQPGGAVTRAPGEAEWPVQNWSALSWENLSAAWITGDAYSLSCRPDCWQWTLLRSPKMAWDGNLPDVYSGYDIFTDQGVHRFDFTLLLGSDLNAQSIEKEAMQKLQGPVIFDRYEGMDRPAWRNNPPTRLWTGAEQRTGRKA